MSTEAFVLPERLRLRCPKCRNGITSILWDGVQLHPDWRSGRSLPGPIPLAPTVCEVPLCPELTLDHRCAKHGGRVRETEPAGVRFVQARWIPDRRPDRTTFVCPRRPCGWRLTVTDNTLTKAWMRAAYAGAKDFSLTTS